ncbi:proteolipid protein 2 [Callorhinchus milii]|uniref:Chemokine-like factor-like protein n=1 Tax=Callorhinchus milii TaxID=7868 RepID=V9L8K2_CALMI|nr:proteolipid protein 2 [Callorhinchus milii]
MELNLAFAKSTRGVLKLSELTVGFVAFVSFATCFSGAYVAIPLLELLITLAFYLLYLLKLHSSLTLIFWPLTDVLSSLLAALFLLIICIAALVSKTTAGAVTGSVCGFAAICLYFADAYLTYKLITFNQRRAPKAEAT